MQEARWGFRITQLNKCAWPGMHELGSQAVRSTRTHAGHIIHWHECSVCGAQIRRGKDIWHAMCSGAA
eukprot:169596-Alexandrium_andersonii.AAC.1